MPLSDTAQLIAVSLVLASMSVVACKTQENAILSETALPSARDFVDGGRDRSGVEVLLPSEVLKNADSNDGSRQEFVRALLTGWNRAIGFRHLYRAVKGLSPSPALQSIKEEDLKDQTYAEIAARIGPLLINNPTLLDTFPTVPLKHIDEMQNFFHNLQGEPDSPDFELPTDGVYHLKFHGPECAPESTRAEARIPRLKLYQVGHPISGEDNVLCYHQNSIALAQLLNQLVFRPGEALNLKVAESSPVAIAGFSGLASSLLGEDLRIEIFSRHAFVDFFGYHVQTSDDGWRSVQMPLRFLVALPSGQKIFPGEHADYSIALFANHKRLAQVRYYIGLPKKGWPVSYWRPRDLQDLPWYGARVGFHQKVQRPSTLTHWLLGAESAMKALQEMHETYHFPHSAYGMLVCNDTVSLALAAFQALEGQVPTRLTKTFPLIRTQKLWNGGRFVDLDEEFTRRLRLPSATLKEIYPPDYSLDKDQMVIRLNEAFPEADGARLSALRVGD
jgi:hypothetical protein